MKQQMGFKRRSGGLRGFADRVGQRPQSEGEREKGRGRSDGKKLQLNKCSEGNFGLELEILGETKSTH